MRVTDFELQESGLDLRTFLHELQVAGKATPLPKFPLKGPIQMNARLRARGGGPSETALFSFMGGEKFTLQSVAAEESLQDGTIAISALMTAADASLAAKRVTSVNVPLEFAMEHFEGLEDLVLRAVADSTRKDGRFEPFRAKPAPAKISAEHAAVRGTW